MPYLSLTLLGGFEATLDAEPVTGFVTNKDRALLAFLAMEAFRPHRRAELAAMFWPDASEKNAAHSLSQGLLHLRKALEGDGPPAVPFLLINSQDVQFNGYSDYHLDAARFRELLNLSDRHLHADPSSCETCHKWLQEAAGLYQGDLLSGLFLPNCEKFEEWRLVQQEELHHQALDSLEQLADYCEQRGEWDLVQEYSRRQIAIERWRETAHYRLMRAMARSGQQAAALKQFDIYQKILADELGLEPSGEIRKFYEQIRSGKTQPSDQSYPRETSVWLPGQGERRQVTTLVCSRISAPDSEEGPDQEFACERYCEPIFKRFGGKRAPRQGAACLVYFGYPQAFEDAARRAVHSGLAMASAREGQDAVRIGIHTGVTLVGEGHTSRWQDRDLSGLSLDIARDCQRWAQAGQVLITEDTRNLVQDAFKMEELPIVLPVEPGKSLGLFRVHEEYRQQSRLEWLAETQRLTPYTGHEEELGQLEASYEKLLQGEGKVVLVRGDSGIGKSRLLWELKRKLDQGHSVKRRTGDQRSVLWLESHCLPHYQNTNLYPVIGLLEQMIGIQAEDGLEVRREKLKGMLAWYGMDRQSTTWLLSTLLGLQTEIPALQTITSAQREQMRQASLELIQKRADEQPLILFIEDLHWSDPSTVDWISHSFDSLPAHPCLVLLTSRPGFQPAWLKQKDSRAELHRLDLSPLSRDQVGQMIAGLVGDTRLNESLYRHIVDHTDGIPLYIEELSKAILENQVLSGISVPGSKTSPGIPNTLQDSLAARLDMLGTAKETAQWAAVLGREFDLPVLQVCVPFEEARLQDDLARLIQAELVAPVDASMQDTSTVSIVKQPGRKRASKLPARYSFKHALLQDAIYNSLLKRTRREYHRRIAEILQVHFPEMSQSQPEVIAQHYGHADMLTQAADFWLQAGNRSTAQGATLEALAFFNRAMEVLDTTDYELRWRTLEGREYVYDLRGDREAQRKDIDALLDLAEAFGDDTRRAKALLRSMQYFLRLNDFLLLLRAAETAYAAAIRTGDQSLELRALAGKVHALTSLGEQKTAQLVVEKISSQLVQIEDSMIKANILGTLALYYRSVGDLSFALQTLDQSAQAGRIAGDRRWESRMHINIGLTCIQLGLYSQALAVLEEGIALADAIGERELITANKDNLSYAHWCCGERDQAVALANEALQEFRVQASRPHGEASCLVDLGIYFADEENWEGAVECLEEARIKFIELSTKSDLMETQALEASCLSALGRQAKARQMAVETWSYLQDHGSAGINFPARMYNSIANVFSSIESPPASPRLVIEAGYLDLMQRAEKISNAEWRKSFLENVPENREIMERWKKIKDDP
jgi:DNA-binding SARP family transcriptional activator/class 3 adenylate cyclase/tetratricopeptide (TPR) repeat protein